jgi:hypothetical protein
MSTEFDMASGEMLWTDEPDESHEIHDPQYLWEPTLQLIEVSADPRPEPIWRDYRVIMRKFTK